MLPVNNLTGSQANYSIVTFIIGEQYLSTFLIVFELKFCEPISFHGLKR